MATSEWLRQMKQTAAGTQPTAPDPARASEIRPTAQTAQPTTDGTARKLLPFTGRDTARNYRRLYRIACDFHERHNPPPTNDDPRSADYWAQTCDEMTEISDSNGNDPFLMDLLIAIFQELERESKGE